MQIFSGSCNPGFARQVANSIEQELGELGIRRFSDGEIFVEVKENVRGQEVFVIQSTSTPGNDNLMELLIVLDALKRASAREITAVVPYYGYARQDRKVSPRTPITAKLVADLLATAGATRVLTMDLHAGQIQGFFDVPVDNLFASPVLLRETEALLTDDAPITVVSPDAGGVERARAYAKRLNADLAIIDKRRTGPNKTEVMNIIGEVEGRNAIIVDDMVDTAGTLTEAVRTIREQGALKVFAVTTHAVLSGPAMDRIENSDLETLLVTDTIPLSERAAASDKIQAASVASLFGEAIMRIHKDLSVSSLFN